MPACVLVDLPCVCMCDRSVCLVCACVPVGLPCVGMCVGRSALCVPVCWSVCVCVHVCQ